MTRSTPPITRRTALRTVAGTALLSVAGCLHDGDGSSPGSTTPSDGSDFIQRVAVEGTALVIEFSSDASLDQVNLIEPNGEVFGQRSVATGSQRVSFELGTSYDPGEYRVVILEDDETVTETPHTIRPDIRIVEMGIGRNQPEKMWDGSEDEIREEAFVTVENRGSGPDSITKLLFIGDVPYPADEDGTNYADVEGVSGIYDPNTNAEVDEISIPPGEQLTIFSSRSPFAFVPGAGISCTNEQQVGEFDLILETRCNGDRVTQTYDIQYSASDGQENCEITISRT